LPCTGDYFIGSDGLEVTVALILVINEHGVYRRGLRSLIEASIRRARAVEADNLLSALPLLASHRPFDLVLFDADSVAHGSLAALKEACGLRPAPRLAVISNADRRTDVLYWLANGIHGFVPTFLSDEDMLGAIQDLLSGRIYVPCWVADACERSSEALGMVDQPDMLRITPRQNEVLSLLANGMSNKEIAKELNISEATTKIHTGALLRALGARNRTEAAYKAARLRAMNDPV
jgi:DNA-binding NarL/FixJ family response regulator